jgi:fructose-bisphosphate aldolase class 1
MNVQEFVDTARTLVAGQKGLLAVDESNLTGNKRFAKLGIPQTVDARRAWRELSATTPDLGECIGGAIQQPALEIWSGQDANVKAAQQGLLHRARGNRAACRG